MEEEEQQQPLSQRQQQQQQQLLSPSPPQQPPQQQQQAVPLPQQQQKQQVMQLGFDGPITSLAKVHILILLGHLANAVMDFTTENLSTSGLVVSAFFLLLYWGSLL
jgi:hemolysin activation/secretion protein